MYEDTVLAANEAASKFYNNNPRDDAYPDEDDF